MVIFPNCKINIGLQVLNKRTDGYHNLQTIFYPVTIYDALEVIDNDNSLEPFNLSASGIEVSSTPDSNICNKAYLLLKQDFPGLPSVKVHLHKNIPIGAGLGGGSSDGTNMLLLLNKKYELDISNEQLLDYSLQLGSDCPFFLMNQPSYAEGRGEKLEQISLDLSAYRILIVNPGIHVNTKWAFTKIQPSENKYDLRKVITKPIDTWKESIENDFEQVVFSNWPEIGEIKKEMYKKGALYVSMSGSGSSIFGIFDRSKNYIFNFPAEYFCKWA